MSESKGHSFQMVIVPEIICYEPGNLRPLAAFSQSTPHATIHLGAFGQNKGVFSLIEKDLNGIPTCNSIVYHAQAQSLEPSF